MKCKSYNKTQIQKKTQNEPTTTSEATTTPTPNPKPNTKAFEPRSAQICFKLASIQTIQTQI